MKSIAYVNYDTKVGKLLLAATNNGICSIQLGSSEEELLKELNRIFPGAFLGPVSPADRDTFDNWLRQLGDYFVGATSEISLPLDMHGMAFQRQVWSRLQEIPRGQTISYSELARRLGAPRSVRAVATACANNTIAVAIPCHRVLRQSGELAGYRWGIERKRALLALEGAIEG